MGITVASHHSHHSGPHHSPSHHSAGSTWSWLGGGTLLGAGSLGTGNLCSRSNNTTGEDSRSSRQYEHMLLHLDLIEWGPHSELSIQHRPSNNDPWRGSLGVIRLAHDDDVLPAFRRRCLIARVVPVRQRAHWADRIGTTARESDSLPPHWNDGPAREGQSR